MTHEEAEGDASGAAGAKQPDAARILFPGYDLAEQHFFRDAFEATRKAEPFLGQIELLESDHAGPIRSVTGERPFDSPLKLHEAQMTIKIADIETMSFDAYATMVKTSSEQLMQAFAKTVFGEMNALIEHVGNTVDGKDKSLFKQFKEGIMKVALDFDDDGKLVPKQLVVPPERLVQAQAVWEAVWRDSEVQAHVVAERDKFLAIRGRRQLLSPC
jgi:hypothetical protein